MYYIDGKGHDLKMKGSRNYLTNHTIYTEFKSHQLVIYGLRGGHADRYTHVPMSDRK